MGSSTKSPSLTRGASIPLACLVLSVALLLSFIVIATIGYSQSGVEGVVAAVVAGAVCLGAGVLALLLVGVFRKQNQVVHGALLAMLLRMALPLIVGVVLTSAGGPLAEAGVFEMILGFYLIGLVVETGLLVWLIGSEQHAAKAS